MADIANIALCVLDVGVLVCHKSTSLQRGGTYLMCSDRLAHVTYYIAIKAVNGNIDTKLHDCII